MRLLLLICFVFISSSSFAQSSLFVRVYDWNGNKIDKGKLTACTDTSFQLERNGITKDISASSVGFLRTKHAGGHNVLVGVITGAAIFAILGAVTADPSNQIVGYSAGEGAAIGIVVGIPFGALFGGISAGFKNSTRYSIDGDLAKWKTVREALEKKLVAN